jgi:hypothetical protein
MRLLLGLFALLVVSGTSAPSTAPCGVPSGAALPEIVFPYEGDEAEYFSTRIMDYLNARGSTEGLEAALESSATDDIPSIAATTLTAELTGDATADVFVMVDWSWGSGFGLLLNLYTCAENRFVHLDTTRYETVSPTSSDAGAPTLVLAADLNANDIPDILIRKPTVEGMKGHDTLAIYEWDGQTLTRTTSIGPNYGSYRHVRFESLDADPSTLEINVGYFYAYEQETAMAFIEYNITRPINMLYRWNGRGWQQICRHFDDEPTLRYQVLHSAETLRACGFYDKAAVFYEQLWLDRDLEGWSGSSWPGVVFPQGVAEAEQADYLTTLERDYLRAFAGYRLMQIAVLMDNPHAVEHHLERLTAEYPLGTHGHAYAVMARALWDHYQQSQNLSESCGEAERAFEQSHSSADPGIEYVEEPMGDQTFEYGFYFANGRRYSSNPDNVFNVPDEIDGMIQIPICLDE